MRLETLAVSKLMERMVNNGASLEELKKVADYMVTAAVYDEMTVNLYDVAEKNGIKELVKKYPPRFFMAWLQRYICKRTAQLKPWRTKARIRFFQN